MRRRSVSGAGVRGQALRRVERVAIQLTSPPGPRSGGPGTFVEGLALALRHAGMDPVLIAPDRRRGASKQRGSQLLFMCEQFIELCRTRPDVVHTHDHPVLLAAAVAYRTVSRHGAPVVFTSHLDPVVPLDGWKRLLMGWMLARCAAVTVMANDSLPKLHLLATPPPPESAVRVIPGAATMLVRRRDDPDVRAYAASIGHTEGPVLLQVANFVYPSKVAGALRLVEAFARVRRRFPASRLVLVGTGPYVRDVCAMRHGMSLTDAVTVPGTFIEDLSLPMGLADIHCHISLQDACPISILEAMHAGKPVVASRSGGIPELIDDGVTGRLVEDDADQIAAAVVDLLDNPHRAKALGSRAQAIAQSRFTFERVALAFQSVYRGEAANLPGVPARGDLQRC